MSNTAEVCTNANERNGLLCGNTLSPSDILCAVCGESVSNNRGTAFLPGTRFDTPDTGYVITSIVGKGAMGAVYMATVSSGGNTFIDNRRIDVAPTVVALKTTDIRTPQPLSPDQLYAIQNPALPRTLEVIQGDKLWVQIMEYIPGKTLKHLMYEHGRLNEEDALSIIGRILYGLEYLHSGSSGIPIIHRDVKPSNIIIDPDNNPYLVDLGIGKTVTPDARTQILPRAGTYRYAPIEQLQGGSKLSADVHAVSAVIYELLTGKRFPDIDERASNPVAFLRSVETELRNAKVSSAVRTALTGGLQQDPSQRLQNIPSLRKSLTSSKPVQGFTAPIEKSAFDKKIMTEAAQLVLPELVGKKVYVSYHENDRPHAEVLVKLLRQCGVNAVHRYGLEVPQSAATLPAAGTDVIASLMQFTRSLLPAHNSKPTVTGSTPPKRLSLQDVHTAIETSDIVFTLLSPRSLDGITNEQEYIRNIFGQESEAALDQQRLRYQLGRTQFNIVIDPMFLRSYLVDRSGEFFLLQNPQDVIKLRRELRDTLKNLNSRKR